MSTTLNTRVKWKRDTSANWTTNNPILLDGEIIIVDTNAGETRFKVGNGTSTYTQLPFQDEYIQNAITGVDDGLINHEGDTSNPHSVTKGQVGLGNVDNVKQYSASNPPPYPVTSVNGKTGAVSLTASDVGALSTAGGTLTGNLTGKYITGTWLQATANAHAADKLDKVCVFDGSGWIYSRTLSEFASDLGIQDGVEKYSGTLPTSSWVSTTGGYYYQVSISGITTNDTPIVIPQFSAVGTSARDNEINSWSCLLFVYAYNGYVRFFSSKIFSAAVDYTLIYNI